MIPMPTPGHQCPGIPHQSSGPLSLRKEGCLRVGQAWLVCPQTTSCYAQSENPSGGELAVEEGKVEVTRHDGTVTERHCHHQQERDKGLTQPHSPRYTMATWKPVRQGWGVASVGGLPSSWPLFWAPNLHGHVRAWSWVERKVPASKHVGVMMSPELLPDGKQEPGGGFFK